MSVTRTERGWAGHFCVSDRCLFRRNTLLENDGVYIVVSTVGNMRSRLSDEILTIGVHRYYETMVFYSNENDKTYHDADASREIYPESQWHIDYIDDNSDLAANEMHETVVNEIIARMESGELLQEVKNE